MKIITSNTITSIAVLSMLAATPAFALDLGLGTGAKVQVASTSVSAKAEARLEERLTNGKSHADQEITRRVGALTDLNTKVQAMVRLSGDEKSAVEAFIQTQISTLGALKTKIAADVDIATLKTDIKSITQSYRIFMLIMPQAHISVAADKIQAAVAKLTALEAKFATRIADAVTAGKDTTAVVALDTDMKAKLSDAGVQASAAVTAVVTLTPDEGDATKVAANKKALQDARAKLKVAMQDLTAARTDAGQIIAGLGQMNGSANASSSAAVTP